MAAETVQVEIDMIDVCPGHDPHYPGQCLPTRTVLKIGYHQDKPFVQVVQDYSNNATPIDEWHKRILTHPLGDAESGLYLPREDALRAYLESETGQILLNRIIQGHIIAWDGHNMTGQQDKDSLQAERELLQTIDNLPHELWQLWNVEDWLGEYVHTEITADTTDGQIKQMTTELESEITERHIVLDDNIKSYLTQCRNELRQ